MKFNIIGSPYSKELKSQTNSNGKRFYFSPQGNKYASVTTVLQGYKKEALEVWKKRVGEKEANRISKSAADRGNKLHLLMESYIKGAEASELVFQYPMSTVSLFQNIKPFVDNNLNNVHLQEATLYSDTLKVAGRVDCIAEWNGDLAVIDFKGSTKEKKESWIDNYFMQASAYSFMYWEHVGILPKKIVIIMSSVNGGGQVFVKNPSQYIRPFVEQVKRYHEEEIGLDNQA